MEDLSDLEREEQLRSFWRDNWLTIVGGIAIGLGAIAGWRYWQSHTRQQAEQAEVAYSGVIDALTANKRDDAATRAAALRKANPSSPYADQADLALARAAIDSSDYDEATGLAVLASPALSKIKVQVRYKSTSGTLLFDYAFVSYNDGTLAREMMGGAMPAPSAAGVK